MSTENKNNLPEKKEEKKKSMFDEVQQEMLATTVEALLPKIKPFIKPAMEKFKEFLGDNETCIFIRRLPDGNPTVFILNNRLGNYFISNDCITKENKFSGSKDPSPIKDVYDINSFVEKLITGDLLKSLDK